MGKRRHPLSVNEHIKTVNELINELPIHVKLEMNNRRKAEIEEAEQEAYKRGFESATNVAAESLEEWHRDRQQLILDQKQGMVHLIHTFSSVIFMMGKEEGKAEAERAKR